MDTIFGNQSLPRESLKLPRFFALILFALAAFMGLPTVAATVGSLYFGKWRAALLMAAVLPIVWATAWLGSVLWSGRSIPGWFISAFLIGMFAIVLTATLMNGTWQEILTMLAVALPLLLQFHLNRQSQVGKPLAKKSFDDLA